jgi:hypothetical protein
LILLQITESETIEKAQKHAKKQIEKWFQESGVKPSDFKTVIYGITQKVEKSIY